MEQRALKEVLELCYRRDNSHTEQVDHMTYIEGDFRRINNDVGTAQREAEAEHEPRHEQQWTGDEEDSCL